MTTADLRAEMMKLPRAVRAQLAELLIESLGEDPEVEEAWLQKASERYRAYVDGNEADVPLEDFLSAVRKEFSL